MDLPTSPSSLRWQALGLQDIDSVMPIEQGSYSHPWSRGNFEDSLRTGFFMPALWQGEQLVGYLVAMPGFEEAHLLNITVCASMRRHGIARLLMHALHAWAVQQKAQQVWLEVRQSNLSALQLYESIGYAHVSVRKNYYPLDGLSREHAVVMSKAL